jgi:23S rRNA pseudouridine1911/1915/1917 synthase
MVLSVQHTRKLPDANRICRLNMSDSALSDEVPLHTFYIPDDLAGRRVDQVLAQRFPEFSRGRLQNWIKQGQVTLDGCRCQAKHRVRGGEEVLLRVVLEPEVADQAQPMDLNLVYEDESLIVVDKPAGIVVHPAAGNRDGTLLNGLLNHLPSLNTLPRAGIVHRLDKDTSGLMVVAKTLEAHHALVCQLQARSVKREYRAIVQGVMIAGGKLAQPLGRHPVNRLRMAVVPHGKEAITHYRVIERFRAHTYLQVWLETGRTHQIRVHMSYLHYPLLGDPLYGGRLKIPAGVSTQTQQALQAFRRQALHAFRLELDHPRTGERLMWEAPPAQDMQQILKVLADDA